MTMVRLLLCFFSPLLQSATVGISSAFPPVIYIFPHHRERFSSFYCKEFIAAAFVAFSNATGLFPAIALVFFCSLRFVRSKMQPSLFFGLFGRVEIRELARFHLLVVSAALILYQQRHKFEGLIFQGELRENWMLFKTS